MVALLGHHVPAHMRDLQRGIVRHQAHDIGVEPAEPAMQHAVIGMLFRGLRQQLHAEAYGQERLALFADVAVKQLVDAAGADVEHGVAEGADAGQDDVRGVGDHVGVVGHDRIVAAILDGIADRAHIVDAVVDDRNV